MNLNPYLTPYTKLVKHYLNLKANLFEESQNIFMSMDISKDFLRKAQKNHPQKKKNDKLDLIKKKKITEKAKRQPTEWEKNSHYTLYK